MMTPDQAKQKLLAAKTPRDLAEVLGTRERVLTFLAFGASIKSKYTQFTIRKKRSGMRTILSPSPALKRLQRRLKVVLDVLYRPKPWVHGFVDERTVVTNAALHVRRAWVLNVDLSDFFPSINFGRVRGMFLGRPYELSPNVATLLAAICCAGNVVPQGAPTSPIISNMICSRLDGELHRLARKYGCTYSRYADDLTFSTNRHVFPREIAEWNEPGVTVPGQQLVDIISGNGFSINPKKVWLRGRSARQMVTGLVTNARINVPRTFIRQIRAMLHAWHKFGEESALKEHISKYSRPSVRYGRTTKFRRIVRGKIAYVGMVRGRKDFIYRRLLAIYGQLLDPVAAQWPLSHDPHRDGVWVLETDPDTDGDVMSQGSAFALHLDEFPATIRAALMGSGARFGLVTCEHVLASGLKAFRPGAITTKYELSVIAREKLPIDLAVLAVHGATSAVFRVGGPLVKGMAITVCGCPNFNLTDTVQVSPGVITGFRVISSVKRALVSCGIVRGASGSAVLDDDGQVVGVAITGAAITSQIRETENHGVLPLQLLTSLRPLQHPLRSFDIE